MSLKEEITNADLNDVLYWTKFWPKPKSLIVHTIFYGILMGLIPFVVLENIYGYGMQKHEDQLYALFLFIIILQASLEIILYYLKKNNFLQTLKEQYKTILNVEDEEMKPFLNDKLRLIKRVCIVWQVTVFFAGMGLQTPLGSCAVECEPDFSYYLQKVVVKMGILIIAFYSAGADCIFCVVIFVGLGQLDIMEEKMKTITGVVAGAEFGKKDGDVFERLKEIINHHNEIHKFVQAIEEVFTNKVFVHFCVCSLEFSNVLVLSIQVSLFSYDALTYITLIVILMSRIYVYCMLGELIQQKSSEIEKFCYMIPWEKCGPDIRKALCLILVRSQKPFKLTAGNIFTLSYATFLKVLKAVFFVLQLGATNVQNIEMHNVKIKEQSRLEKKKIMHLIHQKKISILEEQRKNRNGAYINDFFQFILQ